MNNDLISRSALLAKMKALDIWHETEYQEGYFDGFNDGIAEVEEAPAVDAVEVVRCKDCIHYEKTMLYSECWHELGMINVYDDCYCSRGERRDDGT